MGKSIRCDKIQMDVEASGDVGENSKLQFSYPIIKKSDMNEEMKIEIFEICVSACEKHSTDNQEAAKVIKETIDKRFGVAWHVVIGEGYGYEVTYDIGSYISIYFGGNIGIMIWKCS